MYLTEKFTNMRAHLVAWVQQDEEEGVLVLWRLSHDWMPHPLHRFPWRCCDPQGSQMNLLNIKENRTGSLSNDLLVILFTYFFI